MVEIVIYIVYWIEYFKIGHTSIVVYVYQVEFVELYGMHESTPLLFISANCVIRTFLFQDIMWQHLLPQQSFQYIARFYSGC